MNRECRRYGHGPSATVPCRVWWAPWRKRPRVVCWVCHTRLTAAEAVVADARWRGTFDWYQQMTGWAADDAIDRWWDL
jgi:hypothetical protein